MASPKPIIYPEWCTNGVEPTDKARPSPTKRSVGQQFGISTSRQDINYNWDLIDQWTKHLDQRIATGDVVSTTIPDDGGGVREQAIEDQYGGSWVYTGTIAVGGTDIYFYNRTGD